MEQLEIVRHGRSLVFEQLQFIPIFSGQDPNFTCARFREKVEEIAGFLKWSDEEKFFAAQQRIAGLAQITIQNFREQVVDFKSFMKILNDKFTAERDQAKVLENFWAFKQEKGVSVKEFIAIARQKAGEAVGLQSLPEDCQETVKNNWLLSMLINNLAPHIKRGVVARNPTSVEELESIAVLEEKAYSITNGEQLGLKGVPISADICATISQSVQRPLSLAGEENKLPQNLDKILSDMQSTIQGLSTKLEKLALENNRVGTKEIICFECGKRGHVRRECFLMNRNNREIRSNSPARGTGSQNWGRDRRRELDDKFQSSQTGRNSQYRERTRSPSPRRWQSDYSPRREERQVFFRENSQSTQERDSAVKGRRYNNNGRYGGQNNYENNQSLNFRRSR